MKLATGGYTVKSERWLILNTLLTYNLPVVGFAFMYMLFSMYFMKFATDTLLIAPAIVGLIFGLARLWDAVTDPVVGYLSDHTRHRMGRRRPWILFSAAPIGLAFIAVFAPPYNLSSDALTIWVGIAVFSFFTATTVFVVPHFSLGAELLPGHSERNRLFGFRFGAEVIGWLIGLFAITHLIGSEINGISATRSVAMDISIAASVVVIAMLIYTSLTIKEPSGLQADNKSPPLAAFLDVFSNEHARRLLLITFVEYTGRSVSAVMALYITEYVLLMPSTGPLVLLVWLICSLLSVPLWLYLSRIYGRKPVWICALLSSALAYGSMFFLGEGDYIALFAMSAVTGAAAGCGGTLSPSIQSDVIDYDEYKTGERKAGTYFACWNFVVKSAGGFTVMFAGVLMQWSGFEPKVEQTELVKQTLLGFFAFFPLVMYSLGAYVLSGFRFNESAHEEILTQIQAKRKLAS